MQSKKISKVVDKDETIWVHYAYYNEEGGEDFDH